MVALISLRFSLAHAAASFLRSCRYDFIRCMHRGSSGSSHKKEVKEILWLRTAYGQRKWGTSVRNQNFYSSIKTSRTYETRYLFMAKENPNLCHNGKLLAKKLLEIRCAIFQDQSILCAIEMRTFCSMRRKANASSS